MHIQVSTRDGVPIYLQIVNQVKYLVASGGLTPGERLPSVRALAERLLVNPNTVARAYRELEAGGHVASRRGAGVFVAEGRSPLAEREQLERLHERIDMLLVESRQMDVSIDALCRMIRRRGAQLQSTPSSVGQEAEQ